MFFGTLGFVYLTLCFIHLDLKIDTNNEYIHVIIPQNGQTNKS